MLLLGFFLLLKLLLVALVVVIYLSFVSVNSLDWDFYILVIFFRRLSNVWMRLLLTQGNVLLLVLTHLDDLQLISHSFFLGGR